MKEEIKSTEKKKKETRRYFTVKGYTQE